MIGKLLASVLFIALVESAGAVEFEPLNKALAAALKTTKALKKSIKVDGTEVSFFYSKDAAGKPAMLAFVEKRIYKPDCTHTWVVAIDAAKTKVTDVRVVELSCTHAHPTREASFLSQYTGKGTADLAKLDDKIDTIAKATGSCKLATDAVKHAIKSAEQAKGKI